MNARNGGTGSGAASRPEGTAPAAGAGPGPVVVTGVGLAVAGLSGPADLLGGRRGEGGFDPAKELVGRDLRHKDRGSRLAVRAAQPALADAGLLDDAGFTGEADRTAVVASSTLGVLDSVCACVDVIAERTVTGLSPLSLPQTSVNVITGSVAIRYGLRGPNLTFSGGPTSGLDAVHWAVNLIAADRARTVLVVGVEPGGDAAGKLLGEECVDGAVALVLESAASAAARGARPRAVVAGHGRGPDLAAATAAARASAAGPVGLWLPPERRTDPCPLPADPALGAPRRLALDWLAPAGGALGVLQCAAATAYLDAGGDGAALAAAVSPAEAAAVALVLTSPR